MKSYTEHEKLRKLYKDLEDVRTFLGWLAIEDKVSLANLRMKTKEEQRISNVNAPLLESILMFFEIDLEKLEGEKRSMLHNLNLVKKEEQE